MADAQNNDASAIMAMIADVMPSALGLPEKPVVQRLEKLVSPTPEPSRSVAADPVERNVCIVRTLAAELSLKPQAVEAVIKLIDEGNTIPFIARYRKEATGGMDDVALRKLDERLTYLRNLEQRKEDVIALINMQGKLTPELEAQIREATELQRVEDL